MGPGNALGAKITIMREEGTVTAAKNLSTPTKIGFAPHVITTISGTGKHATNVTKLKLLKKFCLNLNKSSKLSNLNKKGPNWQKKFKIIGSVQAAKITILASERSVTIVA